MFLLPVVSKCSCSVDRSFLVTEKTSHTLVILKSWLGTRGGRRSNSSIEVSMGTFGRHPRLRHREFERVVQLDRERDVFFPTQHVTPANACSVPWTGKFTKMIWQQNLAANHCRRKCLLPIVLVIPPQHPQRSTHHSPIQNSSQCHTNLPGFPSLQVLRAGRLQDQPTSIVGGVLQVILGKLICHKRIHNLFTRLGFQEHIRDLVLPLRMRQVSLTLPMSLDLLISAREPINREILPHVNILLLRGTYCDCS